MRRSRIIWVCAFCFREVEFEVTAPRLIRLPGKWEAVNPSNARHNKALGITEQIVFCSNTCNQMWAGACDSAGAVADAAAERVFARVSREGMKEARQVARSAVDRLADLAEDEEDEDGDADGDDR